MTVSLVVNGTTFFYPETGDTLWGPEATDWASAVTTGMLQKAGGAFTLLAEVDFGAGFGLKSLYFKTRTANNASAGQYRLARADVISWRNQANSADLDLSVNASNQLLFNGAAIGVITAVSDTNSIDLTLTGTTLTADLRLSVTAAGAGFQDVTLTTLADGVQAKLANTAIASAITYSDTNSINATLASTTLTYDLRLSVSAPDAGYTAVAMTIESDGLQGQVANADIIAAIPNASTSVTGLLTDTDWDTFNGKQPAGNYITALTGDVTASGPGSVAATIANNAVTNAKAAQMATMTIKGNNTGGASDPLDLTATQATAMLNNMVGDSGSGGTKGLVPAPAAGDAAASKFLSAGGTWAATPGAPNWATEALNYTVACSVAASALTIALKTQAGTDPAGGDPVSISFRDTTATAGGYTVVQATAATSLVISSGSTLGHTSAIASPIYVYALNNAGTIELAASTLGLSDFVVQTTTAEGGAGAADSATVMYSTTARTDKAVRLLAKLTSTQATAGTWATAPNVSLGDSSVFPSGAMPGIVSGLSVATGYIGEIVTSGAMTETTSVSTTFADVTGASITLTPGFWMIHMNALLGISGGTGAVFVQLFTSANVYVGGNAQVRSTDDMFAGQSIIVPVNITASTTYKLRIAAAGGTGYFRVNNDQSVANDSNAQFYAIRMAA